MPKDSNSSRSSRSLLRLLACSVAMLFCLRQTSPANSLRGLRQLQLASSVEQSQNGFAGSSIIHHAALSSTQVDSIPNWQVLKKDLVASIEEEITQRLQENKEAEEKARETMKQQILNVLDSKVHALTKGGDGSRSTGRTSGPMTGDLHSEPMQQSTVVNSKWNEEKAQLLATIEAGLKQHLKSVETLLQEQTRPMDADEVTVITPTTEYTPSKTKAKSEGKASFSACLLTMDDNHFLIEWLAYHYHVMPLRRLIVAMDPDSKTSPIPILNRWRGLINITLWDDKHIYEYKPKRHKNKLEGHRTRQRDFYQQCSLALKGEGRGWTLFTDTDEYTMINPRVRDAKEPLYKLGQQALDIPSQEESGSVLKLLQRGFNGKQDQVCLSITRKNFGTRESPDQQLNSTKRYAFNTSHFQTYRWRHHGKGNPIGKTMVDLSRVNASSIEGNSHITISAHRAIRDVCPRGDIWKGDRDNAFILYHYSGTLEQTLFRSNDNRGMSKDGNGTAYRIERYYADKKKNVGFMAPPVIQGWLDGFISQVGLLQAQRLLKHVGKPKEASS